MNFFWSNAESSNTLRILFWFRAVSILGQIVTTVLAKLVFAFPLHEVGIACVIGVLLVVNAYTWVRSNSALEPPPVEIFSQLLIDIAALTTIFYFAGGAANPFVSMYLLPLAIGAVLLSRAWVWVLALISIAVYSYLMWLFPTAHAHHSDQSFNLHVLGMWISFLISACVIAYFVIKMRAALFAKDKLLATAREQAIRDEKLVSLGALAASTAHELGTPLGTIQLIVSELQENKISQQDIELLLKQVRRCKQALAEMSTSAGGVPLEGGTLVDIKEYLRELIESWHDSRPNIVLSTELRGQVHSAVVAEKALSKALVNLLDNAADASPDSVQVTADWDAQQVNIMVMDKGKGISPQLLEDIGKKPFSDKPDGIGIGAFLSHEIIRRLGGVVKLNNRSLGGLKTTVTLPLQMQ